jgi:hypothetical protein
MPVSDSWLRWLQGLQEDLCLGVDPDWWPRNKVTPPPEVPVPGFPHDKAILEVGEDTRAVLGMAATVFGLVLPGTPVWQALDDCVRCLASDPARAAQTHELRQQLRAMSRGRGRLHLLGWETGFLVATLREFLRRQEQRDRRRLEAESGAYAEAVAAADKAVCEPPPFVYRRKEYHFPYRQALLLECLKDREPVYEPYVAGHVWGGMLPKNYRGRLRALTKDANDSLSERGLQLKIKRPTYRHLLLDKVTGK